MLTVEEEPTDPPCSLKGEWKDSQNKTLCPPSPPPHRLFLWPSSSRNLPSSSPTSHPQISPTVATGGGRQCGESVSRGSEATLLGWQVGAACLCSLDHLLWDASEPWIPGGPSISSPQGRQHLFKLYSRQGTCGVHLPGSALGNQEGWLGFSWEQLIWNAQGATG